MIEFLSKPWPWYVAGVLFGIAVPALLLIGNKTFGVSSSLRHICAACLPERFSYFNYNWKKESWNLFFISANFSSSNARVVMIWLCREAHAPI